MLKGLTNFYYRINPFIKEIKIIYNGAKLSRNGNCYDIALPNDFKPKVLFPDDPKMAIAKIPLGVQMQLPKHYRGVLLFRSSTALNYHYISANGFGEIEWDYSGQWNGLVATIPSSITAKKGARLFQFYIEPVWDAPWYIKACHIFAKFKFMEVNQLSTTRGGLGHTGK